MARSYWLVLTLFAAACASRQARPPVAKAEPPRPSESVTMPEGYVAVRVAGVIPTEEGAAVLLTDDQEQVVLPIFIGGTEALSIQLRLEQREHVRPLTHDLLEAILGTMGGEIVKVHVDDLREGVFIGSVFVRQKDWVFKVDARPSDAVALAIGNQVPVYVARAVLDQAGVKRDDLEQRRVTPPPGGQYSLLQLP